MRPPRHFVPLALPFAAVFATLSPALAQPSAQVSADDLGKLVEALRGEPQRPMKVRLQAALILGRAGSTDAVPALIGCIDGDPDYPVRAACAMALGNAGEVRAVEPLFGRLEDEEQLVRDEARRALVKLARPEAMPYFEAAREQGSTRVRLALAVIVSELGGAEGGMLLAELLGDRDEAVREEAAHALGKMSQETADALLLRSLEHPNYRVKAQAARLLGSRKHRPALEKLVDLAGSPLEAVEVHEAARAALRDMRELLDFHRLASEARNAELERSTRVEALVVLSALGGPDSLQVLLEVLTDADESMRGSAAQALAEMGNPRALPALREAEKRSGNERIAKVIAVSIRKLERSGAP